MSSTPEEKPNLFLELGDIIKVLASSNTALNDKMFFIQYLDENEVNLVDIESSDVVRLGLTDNAFDDKSIETVEILSRADEKGYARQNNLLPGTWITVQFGGDVPITVNGEITSLEEDMIEMSMWPGGQKMYMDFAYKGVPKDLPIDSIRPFTPPEKEKKLSPEPEFPELDVTPPLVEVEGKEAILPAPDIGVSLEDVDVVIPDVLAERKEVLLDADDIVFGEELETIRQLVPVPEAETRYGIEVQSNDLLDDLLSTIPTAGRTKKVLNSLHVMIERFQQLRQIYSKLSDDGEVEMPDKKGAGFKPLVQAAEKLSQQLYWLLPIVKNRKILYDFDIDEEDENSGIVETTLAVTQTEIYDLVQQYKQNMVPDGQNKYRFLYNRLNPLLTPFENPLNQHDIIARKRTGTDLDVIVNNNGDMYSSVLCGNINNEYTRPSKAFKIRLAKSRFIVDRYEVGLRYPQARDRKLVSSIGREPLLPLTPSDMVYLNGFLTLPEAIVNYSHINLPATSIYDQSVLNLIPFTYFKYLNNATYMVSNTIEQDSLAAPRTMENDDYLKNIESFVFTEDIGAADRGQDEYKSFLNQIVPRTRTLFNLVKRYIVDSTSYFAIVQYLQPFLIFPDDITFKQYETIVEYMRGQILDLKKTLARNGNKFSSYLGYNYNADIGFKNSYLFDLLTSETLQQEGTTFSFISAAYNIKEATSSEFIRKILIADDGRLFMSALALDEVELFVSFDIESAITAELKVADEGPSKEGKGECRRFIIAKYYIDVDDLREDNGHNDIYFDDKYDETRYDIIDEFSEQQASMDPTMFNNFLVEHLTRNVGLSLVEANKEATAMITKKRRVAEGDYAYTTDENNRNVYFVRDGNNTWIHVNDMDGVPLSSSTFCNLKKSCLMINKACGDIVINKHKIKKQLIDEMLSQFDSSVKLSNEELLIKLKDALRRDAVTIKSLNTLRRANSLKYDVTKKLIGESVQDRQVVTSPFAELRDLILSESNFVSRLSDILKFINKTCRPAQSATDEDEFWFYCIDTNTKLLPTFYDDLANGYFANKYEDTLRKITAKRGEISDDGDKIVDKHSGYLIRRLEFDEAEGYDEAGYKMVSRAVLREDIGDVLLDMSFKPTETLRSKDGLLIRNIALTLDKQMSISIGSNIDFIIRNVESTLDDKLPSERDYVEQVKRARKRGKRLGSYKDIHDEALLLLTLGYYLVTAQTMMPSVATNKTFRGCGPKSFVGYPLEGVGDFSSLKYISCVALKLRSRTRPWQRLPKLVKGKAINILKGFMMKLKTVIDKEILVKEYVRDRISMKLKYLEDIVPDKAVSDEFDVRRWLTFLPPLYPVRITGLQSVGPTFREHLLKELRSGSPEQFKRMMSLYGKITLFSLQIQEKIQRVVNEETLLLQSVNNNLLLANACCNDGPRDTVAYFVSKEPSIKKTNDTVLRLETIYNEVESLIIASYLFDPYDTKLKYPTVPKVFSEETIYKAFIRFCYFNSGLLLKPSFHSVCGKNASEFKSTDSIERKIEIMRSEGKVYSTASFMRLMDLVNKANIIHVNLDKPVLSPRAVFEAYLKSHNVETEGTPLGNFMKLGGEVLDRFDVLREEDEGKKQANSLGEFDGFLTDQIDSLTNLIDKYLDVNTGTPSFFDFMGTVDVWKLRGENIYMSREDETAAAFYTYCRTNILNILRIFPTMIINKISFKNPHIPDHWKSGAQKLSNTHIKDIQRIIEDEYKILNKFYGDEPLHAVLDGVIHYPIVQTILDIVDILPFFADVRLKPDQRRKETILNGKILKKTMKFLMLYSMSQYIHMSESLSLKIGTSTIEGEIKLPSHPGDYGATLEDEILIGQRMEVNKKTASLLQAFLTIMSAKKRILNISNYEINQTVLKSKEKEKAKITKRLGDLSVDERRVEDLMKTHRLGLWGVGQTRALFVYDEHQYDAERQEFENDALLELRLDAVDGVTERIRDIYKMDHLEEQVVADRVRMELNNDMMALPGDDDVGERDDDAVGYAAWTGDN